MSKPDNQAKRIVAEHEKVGFKGYIQLYIMRLKM